MEQLNEEALEKYFYLILQVLAPNDVRDMCNMKEVYNDGGKRLSGVSIENDQ